MIIVNRITNANVYLDGESYLGQAEEIKLPDVQTTMSEHKGLGLVGKFELPTGFDKLDGTMKFNSHYLNAFAKIANPFVAVALQVRANLERHTSQGRIEQVPLVTFLTVLFKKFPAGMYKQHDNAEFETAFTCNYIKQVVDGAEVFELDVMSNIFKVNGEDQLAAYRASIGA